MHIEALGYLAASRTLRGLLPLQRRAQASENSAPGPETAREFLLPPGRDYPATTLRQGPATRILRWRSHLPNPPDAPA